MGFHIPVFLFDIINNANAEIPLLCSLFEDINTVSLCNVLASEKTNCTVKNATIFVKLLSLLGPIFKSLVGKESTDSLSWKTENYDLLGALGIISLLYYWDINFRLMC